MVVSCPVWVLGTELRSCAGRANYLSNLSALPVCTLPDTVFLSPESSSVKQD